MSYKYRRTTGEYIADTKGRRKVGKSEGGGLSSNVVSVICFPCFEYRINVSPPGSEFMTAPIRMYCTVWLSNHILFLKATPKSSLQWVRILGNTLLNFGVYSRVSTICKNLETLKGPCRFRIFKKKDIWKTGFRFPLSPGVSSLGVAPPDFGRSVNPISTWGDRLCPPNYYWQPRISRPSDGPEVKRQKTAGRCTHIFMMSGGFWALLTYLLTLIRYFTT